MLGRVYIWLIEHYDEDLELAISEAEDLLDSRLGEIKEVAESIRKDIDELVSRR